MEIWQSLGNLSPGVAVGALCLYFYNAATLKYLDERKEMIQAAAAERKEGQAEMQRLVDRYDARLEAATRAMADMNNQMHALKGETQKLWSRLELALFTKPGQGGGND